MHHDVEVIQQHPALFSIALPAYGLRIMPTQRFLDAVNDRADLALV
jgi:hypothetical protein